jgi:hypothetical protein
MCSCRAAYILLHLLFVLLGRLTPSKFCSEAPRQGAYPVPPGYPRPTRPVCGPLMVRPGGRFGCPEAQHPGPGQGTSALEPGILGPEVPLAPGKGVLWALEANSPCPGASLKFCAASSFSIPLRCFSACHISSARSACLPVPALSFLLSASALITSSCSVCLACFFSEQILAPGSSLRWRCMAQCAMHNGTSRRFSTSTSHLELALTPTCALHWHCHCQFLYLRLRPPHFRCHPHHAPRAPPLQGAQSSPLRTTARERGGGRGFGRGWQDKAAQKAQAQGAASGLCVVLVCDGVYCVLGAGGWRCAGGC